MALTARYNCIDRNFNRSVVNDPLKRVFVAVLIAGLIAGCVT